MVEDGTWRKHDGDAHLTMRIHASCVQFLPEVIDDQPLDLAVSPWHWGVDPYRGDL
jgi:hypothetical protein